MAKLLLVEDNQMLQEILSEILALNDYEVFVAGNGEEALTITAEKKPDLILMDMSLPVLDGWEATRRIKANPATSHIPIIALTAHALAGDRKRSLEAGCDDYETKPVEFPKLLKKIQSYMDKG